MNARVESVEELEKVAHDFIESLSGISRAATLVTLRGELGAGKTTFVQSCARAFGIKEVITSPTYVILKSYELSSDAPFDTFTHIDAYRLDSPDELQVLGWEELLSDPDRVIFLEWPERVHEILPVPRIEIELTHCGESCREVDIVYPKLA